MASPPKSHPNDAVTECTKNTYFGGKTRYIYTSGRIVVWYINASCVDRPLEMKKLADETVHGEAIPDQ